MPCILIVDDDEDTREALRVFLQDEGFTARAAADGEEAIRQIASEDPPSLVFLDARMPRLDGQQVLDSLASRPALDGVPVVLVSADAASLAHRRAVAVLPKPYNLEDLMALVRRYCSVT